MMNHTNRYLPPLNLCYLQRKAYQQHLRKLQTIKYSLKNCKNISKPSQQSKNQLRDTSSHSRYMNIIRYQSQQQIQQKLSPFQKRVIRATDQQNQRLFNHIRNCVSTINRKQIAKETFHQEQIKNRIRKFKSMPSSNKPSLKSELSLNIIQERERNKLIESHSRHSHRYNPLILSQSRPDSLDDISQLTVKAQNVKIKQKTEPSDRQRRKTEPSDRYITERVLLYKNTNKIKSHFDQKDRSNEFTLKARAKVIALRKNAETYSRLLQSSSTQEPHPCCFTSQLEHYSQIQKQTD